MIKTGLEWDIALDYLKNISEGIDYLVEESKKKIEKDEKYNRLMKIKYLYEMRVKFGDKTALDDFYDQIQKEIKNE